MAGTLYVASVVLGRRREDIDKTVSLKVVHLTTTFLANKGYSPHNWDVPQLDDPEFARQVELLYADLPVIVRYWRKLTNLKWAHTTWNGIDLLMDSLNKSEPLPTFRLTKIPGSINASLITEYVIGYIIAMERCFFEAKETQKQCEWKQHIYAKTRKLRSVTVGILGVGDIGAHVARACKTFGMTVWGLTRRQRTEADALDCIDVYRTPDDIPDLLANCDYICNVLPSTGKTKNLLSGEVLSSCKGSVLINVGRGDVVDNDSVEKALRQGWLRGAVLDVFEPEPLPPSSPLWRMPNVVITPHVSGWSYEEQHMESVNECFFTNFERYMSGQPLICELDWEQGY